MIKHLALHSRSPLAWLRTVRRPIATTVMVSFILSPYGALAGAVPDVGAPPNQQATVNTQAGVEVVDIVPPTPDGISHNKWQQFNVPAAGMVLNNATGTAGSQLVGSVSANPRLNGTSASVILNEVTSNNPSSLLGPLEVAGQAARVIIANPNGITCNGCGFINTPHVQLTTGIPVLQGGALAFDITGGTVDIAQPGLTQLASRLDLVARQIRVLGQIQSDGDLNLMAANGYRIDADALNAQSTVPGLGTPPAPPQLAIDISQSVRAGSITLVVETDGTDPFAALPGVSITQSVEAADDLFIASRGPIAIAASIAAGNDLGIANRGGWLSASGLWGSAAAPISAGRDIQLLGYHLELSTLEAGRDVVVGINNPLPTSDYAFARAALIQSGRDTKLLGPGGNSTGYDIASLSAGQDLLIGNEAISLMPALQAHTGAYRAIANAPPRVSLLPAAQWLDDDGGWFPKTRLGTVSIGRNADLMGVDAASAQIFVPGDLTLRANSTNGTHFEAGGNIRAVLSGGEMAELTTDLSAGGDLSIEVGNGVFAPPPALVINSATLSGNTVSVTLPGDFTNFGQITGTTLEIGLGGEFINSGTLLSAQDIRVAAASFTNTARIDQTVETHQYTGEPLCIDGLTTNCIHPALAEPSPEPYPGCKTKYRGTCSATVDVLKSTATIAAGRDLIIDSPSVSNRGATATAGRNIDIATNAFANTARSYGIDWSAQWSDKPLLLSQNNSTCTSNCVSDLSLDWVRSATGHIDLGTLKANMQAGGVFSVDTYPRSGTPAILTPSTTPPDTVQDNANASNSAPASPSSFVNTGNITAASLVIKADNIRNGLDVAKDYYQRTEAPTLPPALIELAKYGNSGFSSLAGTYSGETLMAVMPPALSSSLPFAYTPEQELAAIRSALLATTDRAWILPGLTWDAETGQSPEQQQQAILAANGAAFAIEHGIAYGTPLTTSQRAELTAPILWYANSAGQLTPTLYLSEVWQQQLIRYDGGSLQGDVAIALEADSINNTGFVLSNGLLTIDADHLSNQKRNAWYYEERDVKGGKLIIEGDTVQPGGFMQAARWDLNADSVYSRSGEFIVAGSDAAETQALTSAFEAQIRAELGDAFTYEVAEDRLKTKFEAEGGGLNIVAMVAAIVLSVVLTPAISAAIGSMAGATAGTMAGMTGASLTTAGLGNAVITSAVTGTLSSAVGQSIATGRVDWGSAFKSGAVAGVTYGITNAPILEGGATINSLGQVSTAVSGNGSTVTGYAQWGDRLMGAGARAVVNAGVSSAINGGSFIDALKSSFINDMSAYAANDIGSAFIGKEGALGHMLTHGVLGAMSEAARGGDPTAGAIGGITAAALAQPLDDALGLQGDARNIALTAITMLAGGYAAEALGHDGTAAAGGAQNATVNNYLSHRQLTEAKDEMKACGTDEDCIIGVFAKWAGTSEVQDKEGYLACMSSVEECRAYSLDLNTGVRALQDDSLFELDGPTSTYMARLVQMNVMVEATWAEATMQRYFSQGLDLSPEAAAALAAIASGGVPIKRGSSKIASPVAGAALEQTAAKGVVASRINIRTGKADTKGSGLEYAWEKHGGTWGDNKSAFTISKTEVIEALKSQAVVSAPAYQSPTSGNYIRTVDMGRTIGTDAKSGGQATNYLTVITDNQGNLVNTFPGKTF